MKGEFEFIEGLKRSFGAPDGVLGIGDDCAVIPVGGDDMLVSTDMMMEGTHFIMDRISPYQLGWKSAASSFSDIAAMGGAPVGAFLALSIPSGLPSSWTDVFMEGFGDVSREYGFPLLGGDTTVSPDRVSVCVTVLGKAPHGQCKRRDAARPGDLVCVTGTLGDSAAGLDVVLNGRDLTEAARALVDRHYLPRPRIREGIALAGCGGVHAMMDISDGIGSDLRRIMEASGVGFSIDTGRIPMSGELASYCRACGSDPYDFAVGGGEDYELLFTVAPGIEAPVAHTVIGRTVEGNSIVWNGSDKDFVGFDHFKGR